MDWSVPIKAVFSGLEGPVLAVLAEAGRPLTGSEVHRAAGTGSNAGVRLALGRLGRVGTVHATRIGGAILYSANREHLAWPAVQAALSAFDPLRDLQRRLVDLLQRSALPSAAVTIHAQTPRNRSEREAGHQGLELVLVVPDDALADEVDGLVRQIKEGVRAWTGNPVGVHAATAAKMRSDLALGDPVTAAWGPATRERVRAELERISALEVATDDE